MTRSRTTCILALIALAAPGACNRASPAPAPLSAASSAPAAPTSAPRPAPEPGASAVSAFIFPGCVRRGDETAWCWGLQVWDEWGPRASDPPMQIRPVPAFNGARRVVWNSHFFYILQRDGAVRVWGRATGSDKQKVLQEFMEPTLVPGLTGVVDIAGNDTLCALQASGAVLCWRDDVEHTEADQEPDRLRRVAPARVPKLERAKQIAAGGSRACAVLDDGAVVCWGEPDPGQLTEPRPVPELAGAAQVAVGSERHYCARLRDGTVRCAGINRNGEVGDGTLERRPSPVQVVDLKKVEDLVLGGQTAIARVEGGKLFWWGDPRLGVPDETGALPPFPRTRPAPVPGLSGVAQMAFGVMSFCVLLSDATVSCWGDNKLGQLGDGTTTPSMKPVPLRVPTTSR